MNPVLLKEMRSMLRERRGWLVPMVYAVVLAATVALFLMPQVLMERGGLDRARDLGQYLVGIVAVVQCGLLSVFAPLIGASLVAGEREQATWLSLLASPLPRARLLTGKLLAACLYLALLMGVSVPVAALGLLLGAIDLPTLAGLYLAHAVMGLALLSLGLAVSTLFGRTWTAGLVSVGLVLALATLGSTLSATLAALLAPERLEAYRPLAFLPMAFTPFYGTVLFLSGSMFEAWSGFPWAEHLLAMGAIAVLALGFAARRIGEARD